MTVSLKLVPVCFGQRAGKHGHRPLGMELAKVPTNDLQLFETCRHISFLMLHSDVFYKHLNLWKLSKFVWFLLKRYWKGNKQLGKKCQTKVRTAMFPCGRVNSGYKISTLLWHQPGSEINSSHHHSLRHCNRQVTVCFLSATRLLSLKIWVLLPSGKSQCLKSHHQHSAGVI